MKGGVRKTSDREEKALDCRRPDLGSFRQLVGGILSFTTTEIAK